MNNTPAYLIQNKNCRLNGDVSLMLRCHIVETRNTRSKERFTKNNYLDKKTACKESNVMLAKSISTINILNAFLLLLQVKRKPVRMKTSVSVSLEEQVGPRVLGQVGLELFAETNFSVLKPNSLGIICMETKVSAINFNFVTTNLKPSKNQWHKVNYGASQSDPYQSHPSKSHVF